MVNMMCYPHSKMSLPHMAWAAERGLYTLIQRGTRHMISIQVWNMSQKDMLHMMFHLSTCLLHMAWAAAVHQYIYILVGMLNKNYFADLKTSLLGMSHSCYYQMLNTSQAGMAVCRFLPRNRIQQGMSYKKTSQQSNMFPLHMISKKKSQVRRSNIH